MKASGKLHQQKLQRQQSSARRMEPVQGSKKKSWKKKEIMFVGAPAGIITALLLLAAFLAGRYGLRFRKGNSVPAISAFCICNPCLHCTCTCASLMPFHRQFQPSCRAGKLPPLIMPTCPSEATGQKKKFKTRKDPPKAGDLPVQLSGFYVLHF